MLAIIDNAIRKALWKIAPIAVAIIIVLGSNAHLEAHSTQINVTIGNPQPMDMRLTALAAAIPASQLQPPPSTVHMPAHKPAVPGNG